MSMINHRSEVGYVLQQEVDRILFTLPTLKVPEVGEVIYIDDVVNVKSQELIFSQEPWYRNEKARESLLRKKEHSLSGNFEVVSVKRYIKGYNCVDSLVEPEGVNSANVPGVRYVETFEVFLKLKTEE